MKRKLLLLTLILTSCFLCGCTKQTVELSQREIVDAISIDFEKDEYTVCLVTFRVSSDKEEKDTYKFYSAKSSSLNQAFIELQKHTLASLMTENNAVVLLGKGVYEEEYISTILYLFNNYKGSIKTQLIGTIEQSEKLMREISLSGNNFSQVVQNLTDSNLSDKTISNPMYLCAPDKSGEISLAFFPIVETISFEQPDENANKVTELKLHSLAIISNSQFLSLISGDLMDGILLIQNRSDRIPIEIVSGFGSFDAELQKPNVTICKDANKNNEVTLRCNMSINISSSSAKLSEKDILAVKAQVKNYIEVLIKSTIKQCNDIYDIDILNLDWYQFMQTDKIASQTSKDDKIVFIVNINF